MRNEPSGWLLDVLDWLRTNLVVIVTILVGWSVLDRRIRRLSKTQFMQNMPIKELDDDGKLPRWLVQAQNIAKPLSLGFIGSILFVMYFPGVKPTLSSIKIPLSDQNYLVLYDGVLIVLIMSALPFIILAGNRIDITQFIKKT